MNGKHDYENDPIYVTTKEIKEGLKSGEMSKKSSMECFDISSEQYDKLKKGLIPAVKMGKNNRLEDVEEYLEERRKGTDGCNYPISKCSCKESKQ